MQQIDSKDTFTPSTGQTQVIGSPQPIVALAGDDVILPCQLEPASAVTRTVEWIRPDLNPQYIHLHQNGQLIIHEQNPLYKNRTGLFLDELRNGNVSLKLSRVKLSDEGKYRCFIPSIWTGAIIQLTVGQAQVIGSPQPIVAIAGDDVILPCRLEPAISAVTRTVEWTRPDLNPQYIHVHQSGRPIVHDQNPLYKYRTGLFLDELRNGNVSLKLSRVKLSDEGKYRCFIPSIWSEAIIQLTVGAFSSPVIEITKNSSGVVLGCESKGWYPEPEVFWLDGEGNILSAGPTETVRGPDGLYTVSSRVTVEKTDTNRFTCRVQQQNINQTRETHIHVPDDFFTVPAAGHINIVLAVVFMCIVAVVFVVWRWRRNKIKTKMHHEDETEQREGEKKTESINNDTELQVLMEGEKDREELTAEREAMKDLDKKKTKLEEELQKKEVKRKNTEEEVARLMGRKTELEDLRKKLKLQLKEVETQREEEEKKLRSFFLHLRREEREQVMAKKKDLETRKSELDEQLRSTENELADRNSEIPRMTEKKSKAENEKEQINVELKETEKQRDEIERKLQSVSREITEREAESQEELQEKDKDVEGQADTT
ncbi:CD276 antigen-like [Centroberyx gerrardi]